MIVIRKTIELNSINTAMSPIFLKSRGHVISSLAVGILDLIEISLDRDRLSVIRGNFVVLDPLGC
jgi:hypothetical protein